MKPNVFPTFITIILIISSSLIIYTNITDQSISIDRSNVHLFQKPSTDAKVTYSLKDNHKRSAYVLEETDLWYRVRVDNLHTGWVAKWYLKDNEISSETEIAAKISKDVKLYQTPDKQSKQLDTIPANNFVEVIKESDGWSRVNYKDDVGYIETKNITIVSIDQVKKKEEALIGDIKIKNTDNIIVIRVDNAAFLDAPSMQAGLIYQADYNQNFEFISESSDEFGNSFYLVKDNEGIKGYIEARVSAFASDSEEHVSNTEAQSLNGAVIVLDPGHGGEDVGALNGNTSLIEKELNLKTAHKLKQKLEEKGAQVIMTRETDQWVELTDRPKMSNENLADVFISIHYDASTESTWNGTSTYYFHEGDYDLANAINTQLKNLGMDNRGTEYGNFQVLRENQRPALLLELGFMTNPKDVKTILNKDFNDKASQEIIIGLENYFANKQTTNAGSQ